MTNRQYGYCGDGHYETLMRELLDARRELEETGPRIARRDTENRILRPITEIVRLSETRSLIELFDQNDKLIDSSATSAAGRRLRPRAVLTESVMSMMRLPPSGV